MARARSMAAPGHEKSVMTGSFPAPQHLPRHHGDPGGREDRSVSRRRMWPLPQPAQHARACGYPSVSSHHPLSGRTLTASVDQAVSVWPPRAKSAQIFRIRLPMDSISAQSAPASAGAARQAS